MPAITITIDERAYRALTLYASRCGRSIEELAEAAVEDQVSRRPEWTEVRPSFLRYYGPGEGAV